MSLTAGSQLGSYEILGPLGAGGMGEVYRGRDTKLGREVALKILPASVANDPDRLARFEREAKLLASLSHANIAQIYGLEEAAAGDARPTRVLVMELAAGEDLTARIDRGPLPLDEAIAIGIQVTQALEAAHDRGIVHRDLKPANIKVSADGAVKVLDFGLAKAFTGSDDPSSDVAMNSPTLTAQATAAGVILGTAAYMSPEQARGREADKRADVWAFGVVLMEMLTGARLFHSETISDTLAAVLRQDISWTALPSGTPAEIRRLLRRCLERDRKNRLHDIADARIVLEEVARGVEGDAPAVVPAAKSGPARWVIGAAFAGVFAVGLLGGRLVAPSTDVDAGADVVRLVVPAPRGVTNVSAPAVSPDGRFVVFVGQRGSADRQLYIQHIDESAPRAVARTDGAAEPFVSPDSRWIAFRRQHHLEKIAVAGGEPLTITDAEANTPGSAWLPNGTILYATSWLGPISAVSGDGGTGRALTTVDAANGEKGHWYPSALPDGRHALFTVWKTGAGLNDAEVALLDVTTGQHRILFKGAEARYLAPGFIVFFRAGAYHAIRFDPVALQVSGDAAPVLNDALGNSPAGDVLSTDLAAMGTLAYVSGPTLPPSRLTWISQGGRAEPLPFPERAYDETRVAPDGTRAAAGVLEAGRYVLRMLDFTRRTDDAFDLPGSNWNPTWHPDSKRLAFRSMRKGDFDAYWKDLTTTGEAEPLLVTDRDDTVQDFTPDGRSAIVVQSEPDGRYLPKLMPLSPPGELTTLSPWRVTAIRLSRDGALVAMVSPHTGTDEVYVQPLAGGAAAERVSTKGGRQAAWSRDGRDLLYLRPPDIMAVTVRNDGGRIHMVNERVWARVDGDVADNIFDVAPDGRVIVGLATEPVAREIRVVINWSREVARKLSAR